MQHTARFVLLLPLTGMSSAEIIMDQMGMIYDELYVVANANSIGGENLLGERHALQVCDDFTTTPTGFVVTEVEVGNVMFTLDFVRDAWVHIFGQEDGRPTEEAVFAGQASDLGATVTSYEYPGRPFGLYGVRTIVSNLWIPLEPETTYFVDLQVYSGPDDWAYTARADWATGTDSFLRDGPADEGVGGYGSDTWRPAGEIGWGIGDSAYRVEAVPEPASPTLIAGVGLCLAAVRRRRGR